MESGWNKGKRATTQPPVPRDSTSHSIIMRIMSLQARFDAHWIPEPNTGCWYWTGYVTKSGYGCFVPGIRVFPAHRIAWELYRGPIPAGMVIDHCCRVRHCVNPDHLRVVTRRQNALENSVSIQALNAQKTACPQCGSPYSTQFCAGRIHRYCASCHSASNARRYKNRSR